MTILDVNIDDPIFTDDERKILRLRVEEFKIISKIIDRLCDNLENYKEEAKELRKTIPSMCEHDRSIWSSCAACDELDMKIMKHLGIEEDENGNAS